MSRKCLLIAVVFGFVAQSIAQKGSVKGTITDAITGNILEFVNVVSGLSGTSSDLDGNYVLMLEPGTHTINFSLIGYKTLSKEVTVKAGESVVLNVKLNEDVIEFGDVIVTESKYAKPVGEAISSVDVIRPNLATDKAATSMEDAINQAPSVQIVDSEPQIRGGSGYSFGAGSRVMVLVDDLPMLSGDAGRPEWGMLPIENLEQIEVLKGASSVLYGSAALSGVINIRTAYPGNEPESRINITTGVYDKPQSKYASYWQTAPPTYTGTNFFHSRKIGNLDLVVAGNLLSDDRHIGPEPDKIVAKSVGGKLVKVSGTSSNAGFSNVGTAVLTNGFADDTLGEFAGDTIFRNITGGTPNYERRARMNFNLRYRPKKIDGLNFGVNFNGLYRKTAGTLLVLNTDSGLYHNYPGTQSKTSKMNYNIDPFLNYYDEKGNSHKIRARYLYVNNENNNEQSNQSDFYYGEYQFHKRLDTAKGSALYNAFARGLNISLGGVATYSQTNSELYSGDSLGSGQSTANNYAGFIQLEKKFFNRLNIAAGARYEYFQINDVSESKPIFRAGFNLRLTNKETYIRGSYGQGFRFPTISEKFISTQVGPLRIFPNTDLSSESSWNAEIAIKQGFKVGGDRGFGGYLDVALFQQEVQNAIEFTFGAFGDPSASLFDRLGFKSLNIGDVVTKGVDVSLSGKGKIGNLEIFIIGGYTYLDPQIKDVNRIIDNTPIFNDTAITYKNSSSDTSGILKYRFEHLGKLDVQFNWKHLSFGVSGRYMSYMRNIDKVFEVLDTTGVLVTGLVDYRQKQAEIGGDFIVDLRLSYRFNEHSKLALVVNNAFNREYMIRPLIVEQPRTWALQYTINF